MIWPILWCDTDGARNDLQRIVLQREVTSEIPQIFIVLSMCALHDILDMPHILFSLKLALYYNGFAKYYKDTLHYILFICILSIFSPDLAIESFGIVIVYYHF